MIKLNETQACLLETWRSRGGPKTRFEDLQHAQLNDTMLLLVLRSGQWVYEFVGDEHNRRNGVRLSGALENCLDTQEFAGTPQQLGQIVTGDVPRFIEEIGSAGRSKDLWTRWVGLPVKAPLGADRALLAVYDWEATREPFDHAALHDLIEKYCGPDILKWFEQRTGFTLTDKARLIEEVSRGQFGEVSGSDLTLLQLLINSLTVEFDLEDFWYH